jgi:hypothetical protein
MIWLKIQRQTTAAPRKQLQSLQKNTVVQHLPFSALLLQAYTAPSVQNRPDSTTFNLHEEFTILTPAKTLAALPVSMDGSTMPRLLCCSAAGLPASAAPEDPRDTLPQPVERGEHHEAEAARLRHPHADGGQDAEQRAHLLRVAHPPVHDVPCQTSGLSHMSPFLSGSGDAGWWLKHAHSSMHDHAPAGRSARLTACVAGALAVLVEHEAEALGGALQCACPRVDYSQSSACRHA